MAETALPTCRDLFYDGAFHAPMGGYEETWNPATGESLGLAAAADSSDVDRAVGAADRAFGTWRHSLPADRAAMLRELAARIRQEADRIGHVDAVNTGSPESYMRTDAIAAAANVDYYAGLVRETKGSTLPMGPSALNYSVREPLGVVARIVAYNHPFMFLASKLAPALAAGNTVVLKSAAQAPLSGYLLAEIARDIFPAGVVALLSGGGECGAALVSHPLVRKASLIGSAGTGKAILRQAAEKIMPVGLELGGKNPFIMCDDVDVDAAIDGAIAGMNFLWAGQSCGSTSRLFVHRSLYDHVVAELAVRVPKRHVCGLPADPATSMGSLISEAQFDKVTGFIDDTRREGGRLICGGGRPADPALANGWFIEPTVFADVTPDMRLFREEVFGPVLAVIPWDTEDEVVRMANDTVYGLTASIWTRDLVRAHRLAASVQAGFVWINRVGAHFLGADFGGYKNSGLGREEGLEELLSLTQSKNVNIAMT